MDGNTHRISVANVALLAKGKVEYNKELLFGSTNGRMFAVNAAALQ